VRVSLVSLSGKQVTLTYCEPGVWFGDIALFDGLPRTHDADAHGETTLLCVRKADFKELLTQHSELYDALLRLNCRRLRLMFNQFEDLNTKPLSARLAKQIIMLAKSYGIEQGEEIRMRAERLEVGIRFHVVEVVVAEKDRPREGVDRVVGASRPRQGAREVVAGEEIVGLQLDDPAIKIDRPSDEPLFAHQFGKHAQRLE
jgi:CRP-like cAMP-binding protein